MKRRNFFLTFVASLFSGKFLTKGQASTLTVEDSSVSDEELAAFIKREDVGVSTHQGPMEKHCPGDRIDYVFCVYGLYSAFEGRGNTLIQAVSRSLASEREWVAHWKKDDELYEEAFAKLSAKERGGYRSFKEMCLNGRG